MKAIRKEDGTWCMVDDDSDILQHYGVMGMKWGVRNAETKARYNKVSKKQARREKKISKAEDRLLYDSRQLMFDKKNNGNYKAGHLAKANKSVDKYLKVTNDPAYKSYRKRLTKAGIVGGPLGTAIAANTKKGRELGAAYAERFREVQFNVTAHNYGLVIKGQEAMNKELEKLRKKKPLGEGIY